ncbi:MAG: hypothetical protein II574_11590 [Ruminococcus sp.]|nr:hypothetical protein [Ruminococcus sp.]
MSYKEPIEYYCFVIIIYQIMDDNEAVELDAIFLTQRSHSSDDYEIKWYDDKAEITVEHGWNGKETVTVEFK